MDQALKDPEQQLGKDAKKGVEPGDDWANDGKKIVRKAGRELKTVTKEYKKDNKENKTRGGLI